jgi:hypothetical protein
MFIICGVLIFIITRFKSFAKTPQRIKCLILAMVCLLSITITSTIFLFMRCHGLGKSYLKLKNEHSERSDSQKQTQIESQ